MMKHFGNCGKDFDTQETQRPVRGGGPRETDDPSGDIAALMLLLGLLLVVVFLC
ncbi:MAG: hypothetical protein HFF29_06010 [Oscillospiraceae bacterium]|nr:hypothetical protein [Oscillospiraceae bacterium]